MSTFEVLKVQRFMLWIHKMAETFSGQTQLHMMLGSRLHRFWLTIIMYIQQLAIQLIRTTGASCWLLMFQLARSRSVFLSYMRLPAAFQRSMVAKSLLDCGIILATRPYKFGTAEAKATSCTRPIPI